MAIPFNIVDGDVLLDFNDAIQTIANSTNTNNINQIEIEKLKLLNDYNNTIILRNEIRQVNQAIIDVNQSIIDVNQTIKDVVGYDENLNYDGSDLTQEAGDLISRMKKSSDEVNKTIKDVVGYNENLNYDGSDLTQEAGDLISRMKKTSDVISVLLERIQNENDLENISKIPQIVRAVKELTLRMDHMNKKSDINLKNALSGSRVDVDQQLVTETPNLVNAVKKSGGDIIHQILEMDNTTQDDGPGDLY